VNYKQLRGSPSKTGPFLLFAHGPWPLSNYKQLMKDMQPGGGDGGSGSGGGGGR